MMKYIIALFFCITVFKLHSQTTLFTQTHYNLLTDSIPKISAKTYFAFSNSEYSIYFKTYVNPIHSSIYFGFSNIQSSVKQNNIFGNLSFIVKKFKSSFINSQFGGMYAKGKYNFAGMEDYNSMFIENTNYLISKKIIFSFSGIIYNTTFSKESYKFQTSFYYKISKEEKQFIPYFQLSNFDKNNLSINQTYFSFGFYRYWKRLFMQGETTFDIDGYLYQSKLALGIKTKYVHVSYTFKIEDFSNLFSKMESTYSPLSHQLKLTVPLKKYKHSLLWPELF